MSDHEFAVLKIDTNGLERKSASIEALFVVPKKDRMALRKIATRSSASDCQMKIRITL